MNKLLKGMTSFISKEKVESGRWEPVVTVLFTMDDESVVDITLDRENLSGIITELEGLKLALEETSQVNREKLRGIVARAWCTTENEKKVIDTDIAEAIIDKLIESDVLN